MKIHFLIFYPASDDKAATRIAEAARTAAKDFKGKVSMPSHTCLCMYVNKYTCLYAYLVELTCKLTSTYVCLYICM